MKLIVGLGNPGSKYVGTRHNVGFDVVDTLARRAAIDLSREKFHAGYGDGMVRQERVVLLKPTTFMNRSGDAVLAAGRFYRLEKEDLLVVLDDLALPLGQIRVRPQGSAGSHNGLQNIIDRIGFHDFTRLRVGIGRPLGIPANFVLTRFAEDERPLIEKATDTAADAAECWLTDGLETVMNKYNRKTEEQTEPE